jgi:hypothetical protein
MLSSENKIKSYFCAELISGIYLLFLESIINSEVCQENKNIFRSIISKMSDKNRYFE